MMIDATIVRAHQHSAGARRKRRASELCASQIVSLPRREPHLDRITKGIDKGVNFGGQSAARSTDRGTAADNRVFVEAVLYRYRAGIPWRDVPERFGDWKIVHQR
jgi:transposase